MSKCSYTPLDFLSFVARMGTRTKSSQSQLLQDYFALYCNQDSTNGFFVEFGACNGMEGSNSFLLEYDHDWNGLLAEPGRQWHKELAVNRTCSIDHRCVYTTSGQSIDFIECGQLSSIESVASVSNDWAKNLRTSSNNRYSVITVTLNELLESHRAPTDINYMSIDTEGSEFECLSSFDFSKYTVRCLTVEHNFQPSREKVHNLLIDNGYIHVLADISDYDDWFVHKSSIL